MTIPIKVINGVELVPTNKPGICKVHVHDASEKNALSWDRYVRLKAAADVIKKLGDRKTKILDVGGYDGALALFLPEYCIDLIDPATTGASLLGESVKEQSYQLTAAIDVLEHIKPSQRAAYLEELSRATERTIILNYPCRQSEEAQRLILEATDNQLIREHVRWGLPDTDWVLSTMADLRFQGHVVPYASVAIWLGQYLLLNLAPEVAPALNRYLIEHCADEPFNIPLYHLVICEREKR